LPIPQIDPPLQPAGYAFAIWGLLYGWLLVSAVYGVLRRREDEDWNRVRGPLCLSLAAGVPWLSVATQNAVAALVLIWAMALPAIVATLRAPEVDRWWLAAPVSLYAGWLTAASVVATATVGAGYGVGPDSLGWAWIGLVIALALALVVQTRHAPLLYGVAVAWALIGVVVSNLGDQIPLAVAALGGAAVVLAAGFWKGRRPT
jgi:hypothetical protein